MNPDRSQPHTTEPAGANADGGGGPPAGVAGIWTADAAADEAAPERRRMRLEAVLLVAQAPLTLRKMADLALLADATEARTLVRQLNQTYQQQGRAIRVEQVAGGYQLMTRPALAPWLTRLGHLPQPIRLSTPVLETLAVVAYRQPVSRASVEAVRGVACGELLRQLMERDLIRIAGRSEELGRPYLYGTTKRFLQLFGLSRLDDLPPIDWPTLSEHSDEHPSELDSPVSDLPHDSSTSPKEPVVSTTIAPAISDAATDEAAVVTASDDDRFAALSPDAQPVAVDDVDDDEEDELYDDEEDEDWDDEDDWDEEDEEDDEFVDDDDEFDDDDDDDEFDDEFDDDEWEEVDDDDEEWEEDDEEVDDDWDDDDEEDESAEDDEDWEE